MNAIAPPPRRKPIWPWLLVGCFALLLAVVLGGIYLVRVGSRKLIATVEDRVRNPKAREALALNMLRAEKLPAGYYPVSATFDMPLITHLRLSDRAPNPDGGVSGYDARGFVFTDSPYTESSKKIESLFTGADDAHPVAEIAGVRVRAKEDVVKGELENVNGQTIRYHTIRGRYEEGDDELEGLITLMFIDCEGQEKRERTAIWFGPDGSEVGDDQAIRAFMSHFALCQRRQK